MARQRALLGPVYLATAASIWGGMYVVSRAALEVVPPLPLLWLRYVVALAALLVAGAATRRSFRLARRDVPLVIAIGVTGYAVSVWAQFAGTALSSAQMGAVVTSATPAFMLLFGRLLLGERLTFSRVAALVLATAGVLVIVLAAAGQGSAPDAGGTQAAASPGMTRGAGLLALAALTWALMSVLVKRVPEHYSQVAIAFHAILVATLLLTIPAVPAVAAVPHEALARPVVWGGLLYLGVVSTAVAVFLWNRGLQLTDASGGGVFFFFQPLVGTVLGWLLLGEHVGPAFWVGAGLVLLGAALALRPQADRGAGARVNAAE